MREVLLLALRNTQVALRAEINVSALLARGARCLQAVIAVTLAAAMSLACLQPEAWWAAICAFALTGSALRPAIGLGVQQIAGTFAGTVMGVWLAPLALDGPIAFVTLSTLFATACLSIAARRAASFLWILSAALFVYMVSILLIHGETHAKPLAVALWINALIGTGAYLLVAALAGGLARLRGGAHAPAQATPLGSPSAPAADDPAQAVTGTRLSLVCALSLAVLSWILYRHPLIGMAQAMITTIAVLAVPRTTVGHSLYNIVIRILNRLLGCLLGAMAAALILPLTAGNDLHCLLALAVLVAVSCHLRLGHPDVAYLGTQFGAVAILAFVHDHSWLSDDTATAYHRVIGIAIGNIATGSAFLAVYAIASVIKRR